MMKRLGDILAGSQIHTTNTSFNDEIKAIQFDPPACRLCNDAGFIRRDRTPGDSDFGVALPCDCARRESEEKRFRRLQRYSNLGPLRRANFDTLTTGVSPNFDEAISVCRAFANGDSPTDTWLLIYGVAGGGKTSLAAALANDRIAIGRPALYVTVPDLLDHLRAAYQSDADLPFPLLFEQVRNAPYLILDDLDASNVTAWADEKLFQLINHRENNCLPTVVVSSSDPSVLTGTAARLINRLTLSARVSIGEIDTKSGENESYKQIGGMTRGQLKRFTFEKFISHRSELNGEIAANLQEAYRLALRYADQPQGWLTLIGMNGCGKTHLAAAITSHRLDQNERVYFAIVPDLLDHLRSTFNPDNPVTYDDVFEAVRTASLLILDDLGAHTTSSWAQEKLYQIFSYRYINELPTVITTNLNPADLDNRLASRLLDTQLGLVYRIIAPDFRSGSLPMSSSSVADSRNSTKKRSSSWDRPRW